MSGPLRRSLTWRNESQSGGCPQAMDATEVVSQLLREAGFGAIPIGSRWPPRFMTPVLHSPASSRTTEEISQRRRTRRAGLPRRNRMEAGVRRRRVTDGQRQTKHQQFGDITDVAESVIAPVSRLEAQYRCSAPLFYVLPREADHGHVCSPAELLPQSNRISRHPPALWLPLLSWLAHDPGH